jgi:hypothetical protein
MRVKSGNYCGGSSVRGLNGENEDRARMIKVFLIHVWEQINEAY